MQFYVNCFRVTKRFERYSSYRWRYSHARQVHTRSGRKGPFVAVNCCALTTSLAEAELFGHEAGACTGAGSARAGERRPDELASIGGFPVYLSVQAAELEKSLAWIPKDRTLVTVSNPAGARRQGR